MTKKYMPLQRSEIMKITITVKGETDKGCKICNGRGLDLRAKEVPPFKNMKCECCAKSVTLDFDDAAELMAKAINKERCRPALREESGWGGWFYIFCTNCNGPIDKKVYPTKQEAAHGIKLLRK